MELIRTRLAVSPEGTYRGMRDCVRKVLQHEGVRAFYKGLLPSLVSLLQSRQKAHRGSESNHLHPLLRSQDSSCCCLHL